MAMTGAAMNLIGEDSETPLAFTELLSPAKIAELRDLMYDDDGEPLIAPWRAPEDTGAYLQEVFIKYDRNANGFLEEDEAIDAMVYDLGLSETDATKFIGLLDVEEEDGKLSLSEWLHLKTLVAGTHQSIEKEGNLEFIEQVLKWARKEHHKAMLQEKVMLWPRVKNLERMQGAARYQYKVAVREQVKFKCSMFREATERSERVRQRRLEEERETELEAEAQERRHLVEMERMALEIHEKKQLIEHCRRVAGASARSEKKNFRHRAAEQASALEKQIEAQVKGNKDLDLHLRQLQVMRRWLHGALDKVFETWAGRTGVARTPVESRTLQTAAERATSRANTLFAQFEAGHLSHQLHHGPDAAPPTATPAEDKAGAWNGTNKGEGAMGPGKRRPTSRGQRWRASQQRHLAAEASEEADEAEERNNAACESELSRRSWRLDFIDSCTHQMLAPEEPRASLKAGDPDGRKVEDQRRGPRWADSRGRGLEIPLDSVSHERPSGASQRPVTSLAPHLRTPEESKSLRETNRELMDRVMQLEGEVLRLEVAALQQAPPVRFLAAALLIFDQGVDQGVMEGGKDI